MTNSVFDLKYKGLIQAAMCELIQSQYEECLAQRDDVSALSLVDHQNMVDICTVHIAYEAEEFAKVLKQIPKDRAAEAREMRELDRA